MAYNFYDYAKPDATQNGTAVLASIKNNTNALRDMIVSGSLMVWVSTVTAWNNAYDRPGTIVYYYCPVSGVTPIYDSSNSPERIEETITYDAANNYRVTKVLYKYSLNSAAYDTIGSINYTYQGTTSYVTGWTWANT